MRLAAVLVGFSALAGELIALAQAPAEVVAYTIVDAAAIPEPLGGLTGNAGRGRELYFDRERVGCFICHGSPGGPGVEGNAAGLTAPALADVAARMDAGAIRLWIVAPQILAPGTAMPAYYALGGRTDPADPLYGGPLLTAAEVEDIVAWLAGRQGQ